MKKVISILLVLLVLTTLSPIIATAQESDSNRLIVQPFSSTGTLINEFMKAKKSIYINMYGLTDFDFFPSLVTQAKKGVHIKIMLERAPYNAETENWDARAMLTKYGITCKWASPDFFITHAKYIIIDSSEVIVLSGNFTYSDFTKDRDFGIIMQDATKAQEFEGLFNADWQRLSYKNNDPSVIISPIDSRAKIEAALKSATKSIKIWEQEVEDPSIVNILKDQKSKGVDVQIIMPGSYAQTALNALQTGVNALPNPYVHAKVFIIDDTLAYIGSNNFTTPSLENERETAILTKDPNIISELLTLWKWDLSHTAKP
ncbi:MAG: phospholipase D-like domain-containing protein [Caldisericaceae bacterium]